MKVLATNRNIIRLALPIFFAMLIPQVSYLANTIFLSHFGELEVRVVGISGLFYLILAMVGYGLSNGMQIQMSRRAGEGDHDGVASTFMNGVMLSVLFGLGMMMLSLWLAPLIFGLSLHDSDNVTESIRFLYVRVWGLPFLMMTQLANAFFISIQRSRFLIIGALAGAFTNILLDYVLIFGKIGLPAMGLTGAALASIAGEIVSCVIMYGLFYFKRFYRLYPVGRYFQFDFELSRRTLSISSPLIVQFLFGIGGWQIFFIFVEHLGNKQLAASQVLRSMFGVIWVGVSAFAATSSTMVSNIIGQGKQSQVIFLAWKIGKLSFLYAFIVGVIVALCADQFFLLYGNSAEMAAYARPALYTVLVSTLIMSLATVMFNAVVGTGNTLINLTIETSCVFSYLIYCYIVIERMQSSLQWAWAAEFVYWTSLLLISFAYLRSGRWRGKRI